MPTMSSSRDRRSSSLPTPRRLSETLPPRRMSARWAMAPIVGTAPIVGESRSARAPACSSKRTARREGAPRRPDPSTSWPRHPPPRSGWWNGRRRSGVMGTPGEAGPHRQPPHHLTATLTATEALSHGRRRTIGPSAVLQTAPYERPRTAQGRLEMRYTGSTRIEGSNPSRSAALSPLSPQGAGSQTRVRQMMGTRRGGFASREREMGSETGLRSQNA